MYRVGLAKGEESYLAVKRALELVRADVKIPAGKPVLVKPNMVVPHNPLVATPPDAVRATLDFLTSLGVKRFIVAEGTALREGDTMGAFKEYGYLPLGEKYDIEFRNLHDDDKVEFEAVDQDLQPVTIRLAKSLFTSYVVSVARMKTHVQAIVTLAIKNMAIGSIYNPDRHSGAWHTPEPGKFSHDPRPINISLARLGATLPVGLAVIDGVVGMEGKGPVSGTPRRSNVALAGTDMLAVDIIGSEVMAFDYRTIGYLWYLSETRKLAREDIQVVGEKVADCITRYKPYELTQEILAWWVPGWQRFFQGQYLKGEARKTA